MMKYMFGWMKLKRKGITPVIAIVLLLMMTVAAAGVAYLWIMDLQEGMAETADEGINKQRTDASAAVRVVSAWKDGPNIAFTLKNTGTYTFSATELAKFSYYFNGKYNDGSLFGTACAGFSEPGSVCTIVSDMAFPTVAGVDGSVIIKVDPPFGSTSPYSCTTKTATDTRC